MDFLNKASGQVLALFQSMTVAARITTGLLLAVLLVSLFYLFQNKTEAPGHMLFGAQLTNREISALAVAFGQANLNDWKTEGNRILVPRSERDKYLTAASDFGALPESGELIWNDVLNNNSFLDPRNVVTMREKRANDRYLAYMIRQNKQIEEADVTISEKDVDSFPPRKEKTALATVRAIGNRPLDESLVKTIRYTISSGGGLDQENVTVVDANTGNAYAGHGKDGAPLTEENIYRQNQLQFEQFYKRKIEDQLSMIQGVMVNVFVELEKNLKNQTSTREYDQGVQLRAKEYKKDTSSSDRDRGGRPGAVPNGALGNQPQTVVATTPSENTSTEERNEYERLPAATETYKETAPLVPTLVKATVNVPVTYFEKIWRQQNPTPAGADPVEPEPLELSAIQQAEITNIENTVRTMLPEPPPGDDAFPRIHVVAYTPTPVPAVEQSGMAATAGTWLGSNWQTLGMFALAIVGVIMLRSMILAAQAAVTQTDQRSLPDANLAVLDEDEQDEDELERDFSNSLKARFQKSGRSLREELTELVHEDPDAAANVLQNWIGDAA